MFRFSVKVFLRRNKVYFFLVVKDLFTFCMKKRTKTISGFGGGNKRNNLIDEKGERCEQNERFNTPLPERGPKEFFSYLRIH